MLSKYIQPGNRIEVYDTESGTENSVGYYSSVCEILSEDTLEIAMPMEKTKLILLSVDKSYRLIIYTKNGLYQCDVRVVDRYKSNNMHIAVVEMLSGLSKYQRRDYYRYNCAYDMKFRKLTEEERDMVERGIAFPFEERNPEERNPEERNPDEGDLGEKGIIVDISGGGMRFVSGFHCEKDSLLCTVFELPQKGEMLQYEVFCKVLASKEVQSRKGNYEHRAKFCSMDEKVREQIIKYIFQEERKNRSKNNYF